MPKTHEFVTTSLDALEINVNSGSAIFEVIADTEFRVTVNTPDSRFYLISSGVYRIDVLENGIGKIYVWKGKAQVGNTLATTVKGGRTAVFARTEVNVEKINKKNTENSFDLWSKARAKEIAQINAKLMNREMNRSLMSSFNQNSWSMSSGYGLWVQDPWSRSFSFLPFSYGWSSPYGFGYSRSIWSYQLPNQIYWGVYRNRVMNNSSNSSTNVQTPVTPSRARPSTPGAVTPIGGGSVSPRPSVPVRSPSSGAGSVSGPKSSRAVQPMID